MIPLISAIMPMVGEVVDRLVPDKAGAAKAKQELEGKLVDAAMAGQLGNLEINKVEAAHRSVWVSGWRPCCGWVAAVSLGAHYLVWPTAQWIGTLAGFHVPPPEFDMDHLMTILMGMLGLGGLRTYEKQKGLTK
jgi:hypothetical protein